MNISDEIAVIYLSCDKYSDLWCEYFKLFRRYWPECPFRIHVLTNTAGPALAGVKKLEIGDDVSWSDNLLSALARVEYRYVFLLLDDFFLIDRVPSDWVLDKMRWAVDREVSCLRFWPGHPKPLGRAEGEVGMIPRGALYRTSLRFPLWEKEVLRRILRRKESAWDFELAGAIRSDAFDGFYAIYSEPFKFANCIIKGRWDPSALRLVERHGVQLDSSHRPTMSTAQLCLEYARSMRFRCLLLFPYGSRRRMRESLLRIFARTG